MNKETQIYWNEYWGSAVKPTSVNAWQFGVDPDYFDRRTINH